VIVIDSFERVTAVFENVHGLPAGGAGRLVIDGDLVHDELLVKNVDA